MSLSISIRHDHDYTTFINLPPTPLPENPWCEDVHILVSGDGFSKIDEIFWHFLVKNNYFITTYNKSVQKKNKRRIFLLRKIPRILFPFRKPSLIVYPKYTDFSTRFLFVRITRIKIIKKWEYFKNHAQVQWVGSSFKNRSYAQSSCKFKSHGYTLFHIKTIL